MCGDLVERLRTTANWNWTEAADFDVAARDLLEEAADRIEALKQANDTWVALFGPQPTPELPPLADRAELIALLEDLSSVNMTAEACKRQAVRMADDLIARGFIFSKLRNCATPQLGREP